MKFKKTISTDSNKKKQRSIKKLGFIALSATVLSAGILPSISQAAETTKENTTIDSYPNIEYTPGLEIPGNIIDGNSGNTNIFNIDENNPEISTIQEMTPEQLDHFNKIVDEQVLLYGKENPEEFRKSVVAFFDSTSELYKNNEISQRWSGLWVANDVLGAAINTAIGMVVGGGIGIVAIQAYIKKVGKEAAKRVFYRTIKDKLLAVGAGALAVFIEGAINFAFNYADFGNAIAKYLDKKDYKPNNGRVNF